MTGAVVRLNNMTFFQYHNYLCVELTVVYVP